MKYLAITLLCILLPGFAGFILGCAAAPDEQERERNDTEQEAFLREWRERKKPK